VKLGLVLKRGVEALLLGLAIGDAIGFWRNRERLDELDERFATLDAQVEAIERVPVVDQGLVDQVVRRREKHERIERDSAATAEN
jgi:hypothetical protein